MEDNFLKIQAVVENYPNLKAELLHSKILDNDVLIENQLSSTRLSYNNIVRDYNYKVKFFPISIVAHFHHFELYPYFSVGNTPEYVPQKLYGD